MGIIGVLVGIVIGAILGFVLGVCFTAFSVNEKLKTHDAIGDGEIWHWVKRGGEH